MAAPTVNFIQPLGPADQSTSPEFFNILSEVSLCLRISSGQADGRGEERVRIPRRPDRSALGIAALLLLLLLIVPSCSRRGASLELEFHEGTDMEASPSPDGRHVALQLWSHIWIVDTGNGKARRLTDAVTRPDEHMSPRWSPDGASVVFSSMRSDGGLFVVPVSGGEPRQLTFHDLDFQPDWSPDGRTIVFWGAGRGGLWTVPAQGGSARKIESDAEDAQSPAWSPDGRWIVCIRQGGVAAMASDGSAVRQITNGPADQSPSWSPDGRKLFFISPKAGEPQVWSVPVEGGDPTQLTDDRDLAGYAPHWMPGSNLLVYVAGGKIRTLDTESRVRGTIPFSARMTLARSSYTRRSPELRGPGQTLPVRGICRPAPSPDGRLIAFAALGDLWLRHADGKSEQVTSGPEDDAEPAWSPDGSKLAYVSNRGGEYQVWALDLADRLRRQVTTTASDAATPLWQPSGEHIIFVQSSEVQSSLCAVPASGGNPRTILPRAVQPLGWFSEDQGLVVEQSVRDQKTRVTRNVIKRLRLDGNAVSWTMDLPDGAGFSALSTQGDTLAYVSHGELWIQDLASGKGPERRLVQGPAFFPVWSPDRALLYLNSGVLMRVDTRTGERTTLPVRLSYEVPRVPGSLLLRNARILTPEPREGLWDVLLGDGRIRSLRPAGTQPEAADRVMDLDGRTVIPGLISLHEHLRRSFPLEGFLYWGCTSIAGAGEEGSRSVSQQEAIDSGRRPGPRLFPSGGYVMSTYGNASAATGLRVRTPEQLQGYLDHLSALGTTQVKALDRREPWVEAECIEAAHRRGLPVLSHYLRPASVAAGLDRKEHTCYYGLEGWMGIHGLDGNMLAPFAQDTIEILRKAGITVSSTNQIFYTFTSEGLPRFKAALARTDVASFLAPSHADFMRKTLEQVKDTSEYDRYLKVSLANTVAAHKAGIRIVAGTDFQFVLPGLHWELELLVRAGFSPLEALRTVTSNAAAALGLEGRLGCVAPGAAADLIVLGADPIEDIRNTQKIHTLIQGGRIIDRASLLKAAGERPFPSPTVPH